MRHESKRSYRRRHWLVNRPFQLRFANHIVLFLCIISVATFAGVYFALRSTLRTFELSSYPVSVSLFATSELIIAIELLLLLPVAIWVAILFTHRVVGPMVRILNAINQMSTGNFAVHLTLRKGDSLKELAEAINCLAAYLQTRNK